MSVWSLVKALHAQINTEKRINNAALAIAIVILKILRDFVDVIGEIWKIQTKLLFVIQFDKWFYKNEHFLLLFLLDWKWLSSLRLSGEAGTGLRICEEGERMWRPFVMFLLSMLCPSFGHYPFNNTGQLETGIAFWPWHRIRFPTCCCRFLVVSVTAFRFRMAADWVFFFLVLFN